jgi:hypothetical protein
MIIHTLVPSQLRHSLIHAQRVTNLLVETIVGLMCHKNKLRFNEYKVFDNTKRELKKLIIHSHLFIYLEQRSCVAALQIFPSNRRETMSWPGIEQPHSTYPAYTLLNNTIQLYPVDTLSIPCIARHHKQSAQSYWRFDVCEISAPSQIATQLEVYRVSANHLLDKHWLSSLERWKSRLLCANRVEFSLFLRRARERQRDRERERSLLLVCG